MKIRFTETRVVDDYRKGTVDEERYEAGKTYDLSEPSARRWISRNAAVEVRAGDPSPAPDVPPTGQDGVDDPSAAEAGARDPAASEGPADAAAATTTDDAPGNATASAGDAAGTQQGRKRNR